MTARPMTRDEALGRAEAAYGPQAWVSDFGAWRAEIGTIDARGLPVTLGAGPTWEAAFEDADSRERAK